MSERYVDLSKIMQDQMDFEITRVGTDGTLYDMNTVEYGIVRGLIGESKEALDAFMAGQLAQAKEEVVDVLIFMATIFNHLGMDSDEVSQIAQEKMAKNYKKYDQQYMEGRTIAEGMAHAKRIHDERSGTVFE